MIAIAATHDVTLTVKLPSGTVVPHQLRRGKVNSVDEAYWEAAAKRPVVQAMLRSRVLRVLKGSEADEAEGVILPHITPLEAFAAVKEAGGNDEQAEAAAAAARDATPAGEPGTVIKRRR